jgi:hypothetical protein
MLCRNQNLEDASEMGFILGSFYPLESSPVLLTTTTSLHKVRI